MRLPLRSTIAVALLLAWLTTAVSLSVVVSRLDFLHIFTLPGQVPFATLASRISPGPFFFQLLIAVLGIGVFCGACVSLGIAILGDWSKLQANFLAVGSTAFLVGEIIFSVFFLTVLVLYKLTPQIVAVSLAIALLIGLRSIRPFVAGWRRRILPREFRQGDRFMVTLAFAVLILGILYSTSRLSYDSVVQYFTHAKIMAVTQAPVYSLPGDPFLVSSLHSSILFTALIQLFGDQSARMLSWVNGIVILLLGLSIGKEAGISPRARLWFIVLMVTSTAFVDLLGDGKVELISTAPLLAGIYWMLRSIKEPNEWTFALIGFLIGFAMIARPYNIFLAPLFVVAFYTIYSVIRNREPSFDFRKFLFAGAWMVPYLWAMGAFHLLQNLLWLGNPIAPLVNGTHLSAASWQWQFDPKLLYVFRWLYPFTVSFANSPQSLGNISPLFVGFLPLLLFRRIRSDIRQRPILAWVATAALLTLVLWVFLFFTVLEIRYVWSLWVLLFLVIAQVMDSATDVLGRLLRIAPVALASCLIIYMGVRALVIAVATYSPIDASGQAHCYDTPFCSFLDPLNRTAPERARVFVLNAYRYYLRPDLFTCSSRAPEYAGLQSLAQQNSPVFWVELYRQGFQYVTYEDNYAVFHTRFGRLPTTAGVPAWLHISQVSSAPDGQERVYKLDAVSPPLQPVLDCQPNHSGILQIVPTDIGTPP